jgi:hypothetical protein
MRVGRKIQAVKYLSAKLKASLITALCVYTVP